MLVVWHARPTVFANYVYLADAWRHGRNWINFPGDFLDVVPYHGRAYVIEAPLPALLIYPAVLVSGMNANQTLLDNVLGAVAVFAAWRLCDRIGLQPRAAAAATAFVFFGTSLFVCATEGSVWFLAHVSAFCFSVLALTETFGRRRPWLVAVWALCAAFSRYSLILALPFYLLLVLEPDKRRARIESFVAPIVPAILAWVLYNYNRWGTPLDRGYALFHGVVDPDREQPQTFSLAYVPMQLQQLFAMPPRVIGRAPWIVPNLFGLSFEWTSAPFIYAVFAGTGFRSFVLWAATVVTAIPALLYYDSGQMQYGVRHALDFEPFLFALLVLAMKRRPSFVLTVALVVFAAIGAYGGLFWLLASRIAR
jgi:hypothetical protein